MSTVVIGIKPLDQSRAETRALLAAGKGDPTPRINFPSWEQLHRVLSANRVALLRSMAGAGPLSMRELARRLDRDFKGVHTDIAALLASGILTRTADDRVVLPYDDIHFDFRLSDAA